MCQPRLLGTTTKHQVCIYLHSTVYTVYTTYIFYVKIESLNRPFYNNDIGEVASLTGLFSLVTSAIGVQGLVSLDRLFALRAKECLRRDIIDFSDALIFREKTWIIDMLDNLSDSLSNGSVMANPAKFYYQVLICIV